MAVVIEEFAITPEGRPEAAGQSPAPAGEAGAAPAVPNPEDLLTALRQLQARRARLRAH
jgi:hypothetical protein